MSRGWWRTRDELYEAVVTAIADATTDPGRRGIIGQQALAEEVNCSAGTLSAEMPAIVEYSKQAYPGYAVQCAADPTLRTGGRPTYRYRMVDLQALYETRGSRVRLAKTRTVAKRVINEVEVLQAGPVARAASALVRAAEDMLARAEVMLTEVG